MAKTSSRSFNQYSGLDRHNQMQHMPSATERLQDPLNWGPGTARDTVLKNQFSWALPLSDRPATPVGRSTRDPSRALEMMSRGTARPGQVQAAFGLAQLQQQNQDPLDQVLGMGMQPPAIGANIPQSVGAPPMSYGPSQPQLFSQSAGNPALTASRRSLGNAIMGGRRAFGNSGIPIRPY